MSIPPSSCPARCDVDGETACVAASIDPITLRPRRAPASILEPLAEALRRLGALFTSSPTVERVKVENGVVCVSRYLADRLVDRRRIKTSGLRIHRHVDRVGQCARVELIGADRKVEIAGHANPSERDLSIEALLAALGDEAASVDVRTIVDRSSGGIVQRSRGAASRRLWLVAAAAVAAAASQALPMLRSTSSPSIVAAPARIVEPSFRLTSSTGAAVDATTMLRRPYIVFFGFTHCPEVCPTTLMEVTRALDAAGPDAAKVDILFVTLDPERDTPDVLADFVSPYEGRIVTLTGSAQEVARAAQSFRVYYRKAALDGGDYTIDHTTLVYLVDRHGRSQESPSLFPSVPTSLRASSRRSSGTKRPHARVKRKSGEKTQSARDNVTHNAQCCFA